MCILSKLSFENKYILWSYFIMLVQKRSMHNIWVIHIWYTQVYFSMLSCLLGRRKHRELNREATVRDTVVVFNEMWSYIARSFQKHSFTVRYSLQKLGISFSCVCLYVFFFFDKIEAGFLFTSLYFSQSVSIGYHQCNVHIWKTWKHLLFFFIYQSSKKKKIFFSNRFRIIFSLANIIYYCVTRNLLQFIRNFHLCVCHSEIIILPLQLQYFCIVKAECASVILFAV